MAFEQVGENIRVHELHAHMSPFMPALANVFKKTIQVLITLPKVLALADHLLDRPFLYSLLIGDLLGALGVPERLRSPLNVAGERAFRS